jgi:hypothetical protein
MRWPSNEAVLKKGGSTPKCFQCGKTCNATTEADGRMWVMISSGNRSRVYCPNCTPAVPFVEIDHVKSWFGKSQLEIHEDAILKTMLNFNRKMDAICQKKRKKTA